ncbi:MFS transporter [Roseomonas sp. NAR14]|uniref:MFS transporter n=1 Tax=Roseomonas acroporae TaxID=2937791 RepID=A0A9X1YCE6_9PROT|nr:MFS transporter [Roseomonas acroporae]MCK8786440.1 MFS transporter [Roseomonas acroporae]
MVPARATSHGPDGGAAGEAPAGQGRDGRIIALIGTGHFLSHFYMLTLPPLFLAWRGEFGVSFAMLGLATALMSGTTAVLQTPVGFWVDRWGARPFLVGGTLLMALSVSAMAFVPSFWWILPLSILSGIGNSVIHPADYAILAGSIDRNRMGRAFALHTFTGNLGFAAAPPVIALLAATIGWRGALLSVGLLGIPVVAAILWQSRVLRDQAKPAKDTKGITGRELLLSRTMLLFFAFMLLSSMSTSGVTNFLITVLGQLWGTAAEVAALALSGYTVGQTSGVLVGGWYADRSTRQVGFVVSLTLVAMALFITIGTVPMARPVLLLAAFTAGLCLGASRTPRDVMVKNAAPPGQIGKVFGFVSSGLPLGGALMPVPCGLLIDSGHPGLVLPLVATLLGLSLLCMGTASVSAEADRGRRVPLPAE